MTSENPRSSLTPPATIGDRYGRQIRIGMVAVLGLIAAATWSPMPWLCAYAFTYAVFGFVGNLALRLTSPQTEKSAPLLLFLVALSPLDRVFFGDLGNSAAAAHAAAISILAVWGGYRLVDRLWPRPGVPRAFL